MDDANDRASARPPCFKGPISNRLKIKLVENATTAILTGVFVS